MPRRLCLAKTLVGDSFDQNHLCNNVTRPGPYLVDLKVDWAFGEQQGCSRRDLGTPPRIPVSRCDPSVRNVHKGNNGIKLFPAGMRFWRGTTRYTMCRMHS